MSTRSTLRAVSLACVLLAAPSPATGQSRPVKADSIALFDTIARHDSIVFAAYNRCDLPLLGSYFTPDLEFYHDQAGLMRGRRATVNAVKRNICGKVHRDLVPGTLEVYPLKGYGAVQIGAHRFCDPHKVAHCDATSGEARFVHIWKNSRGRWQITRVISYDHVSRPG